MGQVSIGAEKQVGEREDGKSQPRAAMQARRKEGAGVEYRQVKVMTRDGEQAGPCPYGRGETRTFGGRE